MYSDSKHWFVSNKKESEDSNLVCYVQNVKRFYIEWFDKYSFIMPLKEHIDLFMDQRKYVLHKGQILLVNPNKCFSLCSPIGVQSVPVVFCQISKHAFKNYMPSLDSVYFNAFDADGIDQTGCTSYLRALFSKILIKGITNEMSDLTSEAVLITICAYMNTHLSPVVINAEKNTQRESDLKEFRDILRFIDSSYKKQISLNDLSDATGYHPVYISQIFKSKTNMSYSEYLRNLRLGAAVSLLNNTQLSLADVAKDSGFPNASALNTAFISFFNESPKQYRERIRKYEMPQTMYYFQKDDAYIDKLATMWPYPDLDIEKELKEYASFYTIF